MPPILRLAWYSLWSRRGTAALILLSISLSVTLLLGVERLRTEARASFASTISDTDLIVGARGGSIQLLLYAVFRLGSATNNLSWDSYRHLQALPQVAWAVPLSLGDSHRGFPVLGTTTDYFTHYRFGRRQALAFRQGGPFNDLYDAVLGAEVARKLGYRLGDPLVIAHGAGDYHFTRHDDKPFVVSGILQPTGTPVDRTVHIRLEGLEAIHLGWQGGAPLPGLNVTAAAARELDLTPKTLTAALLGLTSKINTFQLQRQIRDYPGEPLSAIIPGVTLSELWAVIGLAEGALLILSGFVVSVGLLGMLTAMLAGLGARRREMAILRSLGARPLHIFGLILGEAGLLTLLGGALGLALLSALSWLGQPLAASHFGLHIALTWPTPHEWRLLALVLGAGLLAGLLPGLRAYRLSVNDGLSVNA